MSAPLNSTETGRRGEQGEGRTRGAAEGEGQPWAPRHAFSRHGSRLCSASATAGGHRARGTCPMKAAGARVHFSRGWGGQRCRSNPCCPQAEPCLPPSTLNPTLLTPRPCPPRSPPAPLSPGPAPLHAHPRPVPRPCSSTPPPWHPLDQALLPSTLTPGPCPQALLPPRSPLAPADLRPCSPPHSPPRPRPQALLPSTLTTIPRPRPCSPPHYPTASRSAPWAAAPGRPELRCHPRRPPQFSGPAPFCLLLWGRTRLGLGRRQLQGCLRGTGPHVPTRTGLFAVGHSAAPRLT